MQMNLRPVRKNPQCFAKNPRPVRKNREALRIFPEALAADGEAPAKVRS